MYGTPNERRETRCVTSKIKLINMPMAPNSAVRTGWESAESGGRWRCQLGVVNEATASAHDDDHDRADHFGRHGGLADDENPTMETALAESFRQPQPGLAQDLEGSFMRKASPAGKGHPSRPKAMLSSKIVGIASWWKLTRAT